MNNGIHQIAIDKGLGLSAVQEIASARQIDDCNANGFGGGDIYQESPVCKQTVYQQHGLTLHEGDAVAWAYISKDF